MKDRGFTLIELVVLAVLGILAGIGVPYLMGYRNRVAHKLNVVNLLNIRRQIEAVYQVFPEDFAEVDVHAEYTAEELLKCVLEDVEVPGALGVYKAGGVVKVEEGAPMMAMLEMSAMPEEMKEVWEELELKEGEVGTYWDSMGGQGEENPGETEPSERSPAPEVPEYTVPGEDGGTDTEEPTLPPVEPVAPEHACRDRNGNCVCDIEGCGTVMHEEHPFVKNGYCQKCGLHFIHSGMEEDDICDGCWVDGTTGLPHVCSWKDGECRCRCGKSRCDHGGIGKCSICGEYNVKMGFCKNCE